jgi:hypothetical protein
MTRRTALRVDLALAILYDLVAAYLFYLSPTAAEAA